VTTPAGLNNPVLVGADRIVKPTNTATHLKFVFYVKVSALGGSNAFFGPYTLDVGCTPTSVVYADNAGLTTNVNVIVGASVANIYTFAQPTSTRSYCTIITNLIVNPDASGTSWSGSS